MSAGPHAVKHLCRSYRHIPLNESRGANAWVTGMRQQAIQCGQRAGHDHIHCRPVGTRTCLLRQILNNPRIRSIFLRLTTRNMLLERTGIEAARNEQIAGLGEKLMIS